MTAQEKHRLNLHLPTPLFNGLRTITEKHGMSYTTFATRVLEEAVRNYENTGAFPWLK